VRYFHRDVTFVKAMEGSLRFGLGLSSRYASSSLFSVSLDLGDR